MTTATATNRLKTANGTNVAFMSDSGAFNSLYEGAKVVAVGRKARKIPGWAAIGVRVEVTIDGATTKGWLTADGGGHDITFADIATLD